MTSHHVLASLIVGVALWLQAAPPADAAETLVAYRAGRCVAHGSHQAIERQILAQVNSERRAHGLSAVKLSPRLEKVAQSHACDMASQGRYTHVGSDGSDLSVRLRRGGYKFRLGAENTARGFDSSDRVIGFWMQSTYHRANILQPSATEVGVGLSQPAGDRPYWVLVLAAPRR